jgi:hypothetical protein
MSDARWSFVHHWVYYRGKWVDRQPFGRKKQPLFLSKRVDFLAVKMHRNQEPGRVWGRNRPQGLGGHRPPCSVQRSACLPLRFAPSTCRRGHGAWRPGAVKGATGSRTRSAAAGEHRTGEDGSAAALDRRSQAAGHPDHELRQGDGANRRAERVTLHRPPLASSARRTFARESRAPGSRRPSGRRRQAERATPVRARRREGWKPAGSRHAQRGSIHDSPTPQGARPGVRAC